MDYLKTVIGVLSPKPQEKDSPKNEFVPPVADREKDVPPNREVLFSWESPERTFVPRSREYFRRIISLLFIVSAVLILAGQFLLVALLVALAVLYYVLSSVPPSNVKHELDNYGIFYLGRQYYWPELKFYFFTNEAGENILNVDTRDPYPGRLILLLGKIKPEEVKEVMNKYLPLREVPPETMFDKAFKSVSSKLNLD